MINVHQATKNTIHDLSHVLRLFLNDISRVIQRHWLLFIILVATGNLCAQAGTGIPTLRPSGITAYDVEDGLPITCTFNGILDADDRLWINACFGQEEHRKTSFYRFDGTSAFTIDWSDRPDLQYAQAVLSGFFPDGQLYGFFRHSPVAFTYDRKTQTAKYFTLDEAEADIHFIEIDHKGRLMAYAALPDAHLIFIIDNGVVSLLKRIPRNPFDLPHGNDWWFPQSHVLVGRDLWFFDRHARKKNNTLIHLNLETTDFERVTLTSDVKHAHDETVNHGGRIIADNHGLLHVFLVNPGERFIVDPHSGKVISRPEPIAHSISPDILEVSVSPIWCDDQGNLLFVSAVNRQGPSAVLEDPQGNRYDYSEILEAAKNASRFPKGAIRAICGRDLLNQVYVFTDGGLISVELQSYAGIQVLTPEYATRAIAELSSQEYLVVLPELGSDKLNVIDRHSGQIIESATPLPLLNGESDFYDHSDIRNDAEGNVWIPQFEKYTITKVRDGKVIRTYSLPTAMIHFTFRHDHLVLCDQNWNLYVLNPENGEVRHLFEEQPVDLGNTVNDLVCAPDGRIWAATLNGLWMIDPETRRTKRYGKADGFPDDQIMCIYPDSSGMLWIGSYSDGLFQFQPDTGVIRVTSQKEGLSNGTVVAILPDDEGMLWVSTYNGLNLVDATGNVIARLYQDDGLSANEFNRYSSHKGSDGRLLFGSINGITVIEPGVVKRHLDQYRRPHLYLSNISWYDHETRRDIIQSIGFDLEKPVRLSSAHRYLYLKFNLTGFTQPEKFIYQYQLEGLSGTGGDAWNALGSQSEIKLAGLPAGEYNIRVRGYDHRGNLATEDLVIPIAASEFFYKRPAFYFLLFVLAAGMALAWVYRERRKRQELERIVAQRTSKIRQDKELIEAQAKQLQELDEVKSRFFTNISHEFRTPLTIIGGMARKIAEQPQRWMDQGIQSIERNTGMLLDLVNQILDLRKLEAGKLTPKWIQGDVIPYLNYLAESFHSYAENKDINIQAQLQPERLLMDYDQDMWLRIISNLLSNAVKYTAPGGEVILTSQIVSQNTLNISIRDTGRGIPAEKLPRIFDLFYQVDDSSTRQGEGTGIGLSLTKELVTLLGGSISAESIEGKGSTFNIALPIHRTAQLVKETDQHPGFMPGNETQIAPISIPDHDPDTPTLLIVEDNADVMQYISACLEDTYRLSYAKDGQEGIETAIESVPDLIISDVMMPRKDGFELCNTLKRDARTSHIPIVLLTARADADSRITGLERGADAYLSKPFDERELRVRLTMLLELRRTLQQRYAQSIPPQTPAEDVGVQQEDEFIRRFHDVVIENLSEDSFGVPELCREIGMSRTQLHNKIKSLTSLSTTHYVRQIRLTEARRLMTTRPELNLSQIAYEVGFPGLKYFSKVFSEKYGISPSRYREQS